MATHIRLRNREMPPNEIECPIGGSVDPDEDCLKCAYSDNCRNFEAWLEEEMEQYQPDKDSEKLIIEKVEPEWVKKLKAKLSNLKAEFRQWFYDHGLRKWLNQ